MIEPLPSESARVLATDNDIVERMFPDADIIPFGLCGGFQSASLCSSLEVTCRVVGVSFLSQQVPPAPSCSPQRCERCAKALPVA